MKLPNVRDLAGSASIGIIIAAIITAASFMTAETLISGTFSQHTGLEERDLGTKADAALSLLVSSPGWPPQWGANAQSVDAASRLGLLEAVTANHALDPLKVDALARGHYNGGSATNGFIDYAEARDALGLAGYDFHLRTSPVVDPRAGTYGLTGMTDHRVAYVGSTAHPEEATAERAALASLAIGYDDARDAYADDLATLRAGLLPALAPAISQTVINPGASSAYGWTTIPASAYASLVPGSSGLTSALAIADATGAPGYAEARELRAVVGPFDLTGASSATLHWSEHVDSATDPDDYGLVEASADGGRTWTVLTSTPELRSTDTGATTMTARSLGLAACGACLGGPSVLLAFHWIADQNGRVGRGWIVDDLSLTDQAGAARGARTFEPSSYDAIVIGSDVAAATIGASDVARAIAQHLHDNGGRVLVLGGPAASAVGTWLPASAHYAVRDANAALGNPDVTHPLLNVPNKLSWAAYGHAGSVDLRASHEAPLFAGILTTGAADDDLLAASTLGAFGPEDAGLILTSYQPSTMSQDESARFFANALLYGRYQHVYADLGPSLPDSVAVSSAKRLALVDATSTRAAMPIDLMLYVWPGYATGANATAASAPSEPQAFTATGPSPVHLSWSAPNSTGGSALTGYAIYRGSAPGQGALLAITGTNTTFLDATAAVGTTYVYNATALNAVGPSSSTGDAQVTPLAVPQAPTPVIAIDGFHHIIVSWSPPEDSGGSAVTGYRVFAGPARGQESLLATIGSNTSYDDGGLGNGADRFYELTSIAGGGESLRSPEASGTTFDVPHAPALPLVTPGLHQLTIAWTAPADGGTAITSYKLYGGSASGAETLLATLSPSTLTYTETALANGVTRDYQVTAVNLVGESLRSGEAAGTTFAPPQAPSNLQAARGVFQLGLTWGAPSYDGGAPVTSYRILAGASGAEAPLALIGSNMTYVDALLGAGVTKSYQITAINVAGESAPSNEATATTFDLPTAPRSPLASAGVHQGALSWTSPLSDGGTPVTSYKVYAGATSGSESYLATIGTNTSYAEAGLGNAQTRYYKVAAVNAVGAGPQSSETSMTTFNVPTAPQLPGAAAGVRSLGLSWSAPSSNGGSPVTGYKVYAGATSGSESYLATIGTNVSFTDAGLANNQLRYYKVSAVNAPGEGPQSAEFSATTFALPGAPQSPATASSDRTLNLTWAAPASNGGSPITAYKIYASTTSGAESYLASTGANTSYSDANLLRSLAKFYKVSAVTAVGEGPLSAETTGTTTPAAPRVPGATGGIRNASLNWTAPPVDGGAPITGYRIYAGATSGSETLLATIGTNVTFLDLTLANGQTRYYKIAATNAGGVGLDSTEVTATTLNVPGAPRFPGAAQGMKLLNLNWTAPATNGGMAITGYKIYAGATSGSEALLATIGTNVTYVDAGLANNQTRYYKLTAVNGVGESAYSTEFTARTCQPAASPTFLVAVTGNGHGRINLNWTAPATECGAQITGYNIYRSLSSGTEVLTYPSESGSPPTFTDSSLAHSTRYYWQVSALTGSGEGPRSNESSAVSSN